MSIAENVAAIRAAMESAARDAGRDPKEIKLCAATKMNDAAACQEAIAAGIDALIFLGDGLRDLELALTLHPKLRAYSVLSQHFNLCFYLFHKGVCNRLAL